MSQVRRLQGGRTNSTKHAKTLADVKRAAQKKVRQAANAERSFAASMQADIANELKVIKTQKQLTDIEEFVNTYGSKKNRTEFNKLQSTFRKEARTLIDTELATLTTKEQLESIRSMVELNGSQAQKAKFAEFESYFAKPTWAKYSSIHGLQYKAPTSGVAEADRIAEQTIHENNMKQFEAEAIKADKVAVQTEKALAESAKMEQLLAEGDKHVEQGKASSRVVKPKVTTKPITATVEIEFGTVGGTKKPPVVPKETVGTVGHTPSVSIPGGTGKTAATGEGVVKNASKYAKYFKKGALGLLGIGAIALAAYGLKKCQNGDDDTKTVVPSVPTTPKGTPVQQKIDTVAKKESPVTVPTQIVSGTDSVAKDTIAVSQVKPSYNLSDEEVAKKLEKGEKIDDTKYYVVKKGDCVWKLIEKRLEKNKSEYSLIKAFLTELYKHTPSHDAIIRHATILTCETNGIKYIIDDQKLMPNDTLNVPEKFDVQNKFDRAA